MRVDSATLLALSAFHLCGMARADGRFNSKASYAPTASFGAAFIGSRTVLATMSVAATAEVDCVECWVTRDDGDSWAPIECRGLPPSPVSITVDEDGRFGFVFILENEAGPSEPPPLAGDPPAIRMIVDTTPPTVQFRDARIASESETGEVRFALDFSVIDENIGARSARLYFRRARAGDATGAAGHWIDAGVIESASHAAWPQPSSPGDALDLRIVATDQAGNVAFDELLGVRLEAVSESAARGDHVEPVVHASHHSIEPAAPVAITEPTDGLAKDTERAKTKLNGDARFLLDVADRHMAASEFQLAAARIEDYLAQAGPDAEALSRLGRALYRAGRIDDAARRFDEALHLRPDLADALDGSALAEATRGRYAQARERLAQLLRVMPASGDAWLHLGDVENRLGNLDDALAAWRRAAEHAGADHTVAEHARKRIRFFGPTTRPARLIP